MLLEQVPAQRLAIGHAFSLLVETHERLFVQCLPFDDRLLAELALFKLTVFVKEVEVPFAGEVFDLARPGT